MPLLRLISYAVLFFSVFFVIGELDRRLRPHQRHVEYDVDDELYFRLRPDQVGYAWLASLTRKSPPITVNSLGLRGPEVRLRSDDVARILATGSSSAFGAGVRDDETWIARLEQMIRAEGSEVEALNAANPGWAPFQHLIILERLAPLLKPDLLLVMAKADINRLPFEDEQEKETYLAAERRRKKIIALSESVAYTKRKLDLFRGRLIQTVEKWNPSAGEAKVPAAVLSESDMAARLAPHRRYWKGILDLGAAKGLPVVFFVPNVSDKPIDVRLRLLLEDLTRQTGVGRVVYLGSDDLHLAPGVLPSRYYRQHLILAGDPHPNAEYHRLMAKAVLPAVVAALEEARRPTVASGE